MGKIISQGQEKIAYAGQASVVFTAPSLVSLMQKSLAVSIPCWRSCGTMQERDQAEAMLPCFTPNSIVATARGGVKISDLVVGDTILTRDNGYQMIHWVGGAVYSDAALVEHLRPVCIRAGALGDGLPQRDMIVSPHHRFLVKNSAVCEATGEDESFVAAKWLLHHQGVHRLTPTEVCYVQIMCEHHEVIMVDGVWTESFQPSTIALNGLADEERQRLFRAFPELQKSNAALSFKAARRTLRSVDAVQMRPW